MTCSVFFVDSEVVVVVPVVVVENLVVHILGLGLFLTWHPSSLSSKF